MITAAEANKLVQGWNETNIKLVEREIEDLECDIDNKIKTLAEKGNISLESIIGVSNPSFDYYALAKLSDLYANNGFSVQTKFDTKLDRYVMLIEWGKE